MRERYETFTSLILNINRNILKIKNAEMQSFGLKGNQVQCLHYLYNEENGLSAKQLEKMCEEDKAAISRTIKYLEKIELVYLEESTIKKYGKLYKLTEKGRAYGQSIKLKIDSIMEIASQGIDEHSREILYSSLYTICNNLKLICENNGAKND